ncbi:MAG: VWA domain-containing protein, partial [Gammaproteobacteria bacterium]|nr:VWA domain-containing protein [Gammaproteobacteria bacterium]
ELDPKRLTRIIAVPSSPLSFRERTDDLIRDTTVTLLIDNSRSMSGAPILTAAASADLMTRVLERCGVSTEVLGFTTVSMYGGQVAQAWQAAGCPQNVGRINALRHIVYKSADQSWRQSRMNFGLMLNRDILNQNIDGEALLWAKSRMQRRPESRRILIVLTDGRPSDSSTLKANSRGLLTNHLKQVIKLIEKHRTLEVIGIGIGHDVSVYYDQSIRVDDIGQLGSIMLTELLRLLKP